MSSFPSLLSVNFIRLDVTIFDGIKSNTSLLFNERTFFPIGLSLFIEQAKSFCAFLEPHSVMRTPLIFATSFLNWSRFLEGT